MACTLITTGPRLTDAHKPTQGNAAVDLTLIGALLDVVEAFWEVYCGWLGAELFQSVSFVIFLCVLATSLRFCFGQAMDSRLIIALWQQVRPCNLKHLDGNARKSMGHFADTRLQCVVSYEG